MTDGATTKRSFGVRSTAIGAAMALLLSMLAIVADTSVAGAADPDVDAFLSTLDGPTDSIQAWTQELATIGALAEQLPGIPASAGAVLGFDDLLHTFFLDAYAGAVDNGDLDVDTDIDLGDGRTGHLTSDYTDLAAGDGQLVVSVSAQKTLDDQQLSLPLPIGGDSNAPQSAFSSTGGLSLTVEAAFTFTLVREDVSNTVSIVADGTTPRIDVDASAAITDLSGMAASIGILGVSVVPDSNLDLEAHFTSTIDDPNSDGHLSFVELDGSAGELAQAGSLEGLVDMEFASPAGHLNGSLHLNAAAGTDFALSLPAVDATVAVAWPDISTGAPSVTATGIDTVGKFLNMTPRDLASGLGQLATSLSGMQKSGVGNLDLPFVKGTLADAVKINEVIVEFLDDHTISADVDPAAAGNPDFVSVQQMFDLLQTATIDAVSGGDIGIGAVTYDDATSKLAFEITLGRDAPTAVALNAAGAASSGGGAGVTFGAGTLSDAGQTWEPDQFVGHHVVAGTSGGTIAANTGTTLTLDANGWTPIVPVAGAAYTISGMQGDVGTVQLGDALKAGGGIGAANGVNATAQVTPSYDAAVTLVLDLQPPTIHDPPLAISNPDGSTYLASATPIGADRMLLRTGNTSLFTADFPIDAAIDIYANAGFLQVELQGDVHVCQTAAGPDCTGTPGPGDHMLQVDLKDQGDLTFGQVVTKLLNAPGDLLSFQTSIRASGGVDVTVPGAADFLGTATAGATFSWNDLNQTSGPDGPQFDASDLSELLAFDFDPDNPRALFSIILKTLQTLKTSLGNADPTAPGAAVFSEEIPVVGRSLRDLLRTDESGSGPKVTYGGSTLTDTTKNFAASLAGRTVVVGTQVGLIKTVSGNTLTMSKAWNSTPAAGTAYVVRSELDDAISLLEAAPSDNLQELVRLLDDRLAGTPLAFEYDTAANAVVLRLDWTRSFQASSPVQFDFNIPAGDFEVAGVQGEGSVALDAGGHIQMGVVIPLTVGNGPAGPGDLKILDDSSIGVNLDADVSDGALVSTLGPLKLALGDPTSADKATAKASYSIDLAVGGATGDPVSFSDFIGDVGATLNASSTPVDCGLPDASTALALCARLPLYISSDGGTTYTKVITDPGKSNEFAVRLPKTGSSLADHFDLTGAQIDGHDRLETPDPADLAAAILANIIDFTQLNGLDDYLRLVETSLNAASFEGKLPLIGEDLQQGADFIGDLRTAVNDALAALPGDGNMGSAQGIRDWVNVTLDDALSAAGVNPELVGVDIRCQSALTPPGAPTVTPTGADDGETYTYKVESYQLDSEGEREYSLLSGSGSTAVGATDIAADPNDVEWTAVDGAAGYRVFRDVGGSFLLVGETTGTSLSDGNAAPAGDPGNTSGTNPQRTDCNYTDLDSVRIILDVHQGDFSGGTLTCPATDPCITDSVPLDIGVPGLSLEGKDGQGPAYELGYRLHFEFGLSKSKGFFVDTNGAADDDTAPEIALGLNFTLPSAITAQLGFITITAENCVASMVGSCTDAPAAAAPLFSGGFSIDLVKPGDPTGLLTLSDLSDATLDSLFDVALTAELHIDWLLKAKPGDDVGFPGIQAQFVLDWSWSAEDPSATLPDVAFKNVAIDAGQVFGDILGPVVNEIKKVTQPLDPVIKTLYAPIPVLSDLSHLVGGDDITIISIAKAFSSIAGGPDLTFIDTLAGVVAFINNLPECTTSCIIPLGGFEMDSDTLVNNSATPDNANSRIKAGSKIDKDGGTAFASIAGDLDSKDAKGTGSLSGSASPAAKAGFSFPVFDNPASLFNVLLGGDVDLVKFDSGPLRLAFDWQQSFGPVYAPPPVFVTMHGSASVTLRLVAGFDTYGIRKAVEKAKNDETFDIAAVGEVILQSLFFYTTENGTPIPVVTFNGEIAAGAEVSAIIIKVGIEGGVGLTVSFLWNDPNADGKFRISEFLQAALNNPICLFTVSGRLYVFLKAYVTLGFSPFSVTFDFTILDVTLLDFSAAPDCDPPPPELGGLTADGTTLVVYAASLDGPRGSDYVDQEKESIKITSLHDYPDDGAPTFAGVSVAMLGIRREFRNPNIERVIVDGHDYAGSMNVTFLGDGKEDSSPTGGPPPTSQFELDAIVLGGAGKDKIKTGIGNSWVDGGGEDDLIVTGDRTVLDPSSPTPAYLRPDARAVVAGGPGNDSITVGNGDDVVAGDSSLSYSTTTLSLNELLNDDRDGGDPNGDDGQYPNGNDGEAGASPTVPDWTTFADPGGGEAAGDGTDVIHVGLGDSTAYGNDGMDTLAVAPDSIDLAKIHPAQASLFSSPGALLVGGTGDDNFAGGNGDDVIVTGPDAGGLDTDPDADGGLDDGHTNTVDTGPGNDTVFGSTGVDFVTGHSLPDQVDDIRGGAGDDVLVGGTGADKVFGGPGDDYVIAESSDVGPAGPDDGFGPSRTVSHRDLPAGVEPAAKILVGGTGNDHIIGGDGGAAIDGDRFNPSARCEPGSPVASDPVDESVNTPTDGNDKIIGGSGVENVRAGGGNDDVDVKGADDLACGESGGDNLRGGQDADQIWGGSGADVVNGGMGTDRLYGNDGNDTMYGDSGADEIEGNDNSDWVTGGTYADVVIGGTHATEGDNRPDTTDFLFGDSGADVIIGDNATHDGPDNGDWYPLDLDGLAPLAGGPDFIFGGTANDEIYGGLGDDFVFGGAGPDDIEGNNGADTILGESGSDDIIGGSSEFAAGDTGLDAVGRPDAGDVISGGDDQDVITGDNARLAEVGAGVGHPATQNRLTTERSVRLLDLGYTPTGGTSGADVIDGDGDADVVFGQAGNDTISGDDGADYLEGGQDADGIEGGSGTDDIVGGSSTIETGTVAAQTAGGQFDAGDVIDGGGQSDVIIGDNGIVHRATPPGTASPLTTNRGMPSRVIHLYDLGDTPPHAGTSGGDDIVGAFSADVILGQSGNDRLKGNDGDDYVEGGPGRDWIEGNDGDDDLVGGSSTIQGSDTGVGASGQPDQSDAVWGGGGDDLITGDNAIVTRNEPYDPVTHRVGSSGDVADRRSRRLLDLSNAGSILNAPSQPRFGGDQLSGGAHVDVLFGQDGADVITGNGGDDYAEGNGGADRIWGDLSLAAAGVTVTDPGWPSAASGEPALNGPAEVDGQDDLLGGSSRVGFRDAGDIIHGNGESDFELGDNGNVRRNLVEQADGTFEDEPYAKRYEAVGPPSAAIRLPALGQTTTRFCSAPGASTCEVPGAFGPDRLYGDGGDDFMYGQDADDEMWGGTEDDDMFGELGADVMFGEDGDDAMVGDRGGIVDQYEDGSRAIHLSYTQVPKIEYDGFVAGTVTRIVDLQHDVNGDEFVDNAGNPLDDQSVPPAKMPFDGVAFGGNDRMRGGNGFDSIHGGVGDDLINGDSHGDNIFGGDGADVLWGGKGCDAAVDTLATSPDCFVGGVFDESARGDGDRMVDYTFGGKGATAGPSTDPKTGVLGADIIDWRPRGGYADCTTAAWPVTDGPKKSPFTHDPCTWFEMTNLTDADIGNNQHNNGIDWQYGGWDRDILQGNVADNGPNMGDRLLDWNGAYNLYTHCNAAYGGFNDVRQHSPSMQEFLKTWSYTLGAGLTADDVSDASTSAFNELAFVYNSDTKDHGAGKAFPSTPGHFDDPNACTP